MAGIISIVFLNMTFSYWFLFICGEDSNNNAGEGGQRRNPRIGHFKDEVQGFGFVDFGSNKGRFA